MSKLRTQKESILATMKMGRRVSSLLAIHAFGCTRTSGRIYDLIKEGYDIQSEYVTKNGSTFKEYWLDSSEVKA